MLRSTDERAVERPASAHFDVVALVTSAGGLEALRAVLRELPDDFPAAVVVGQHLGGQGSGLVEILGRQTKLPVVWASAGTRLTPGCVFVGPPRRQLEILPDRTCAVGEGRIGAADKPLNILLTSLADSCGPRALAVVLTGMGKDAAAGAAAIKRAGGVVLAQSEDTAEQPSMPRAAIQSGAADLVLPLHEIGAVITDVVTDGDLPRSHSEIEAAETLFAGQGEVRRLLRTIDWSRTPLGPLGGWPISLQTTLRLVLDSSMPMCILWGRELIQLYNDPYRLFMGPRHPAGLGQPNSACWPEVWHLNQPIYARVWLGESLALNDALYPILRGGTLEDAWFDLSFAPVRHDAGAVAGVLATVVETTERVLSQRRLRTLQAVTTASAGTTTVHLAMERAVAALAGNSQDVPFALGYMLDERSRRAQLVAASGVEAGGPMAPRTIDVRAGHPAWPLGTALALRADRPMLLIDDLAERFRGTRIGVDGATPASAMLLPLRLVTDEPPAGVLCCGINPRLPLDASYRGFLELVGSGVGAGLAEAQIRQKERQRHERLADLDRAKTEFFSNISHEFRTPLTLMLAPLEELLRRQEQFPRAVADDIQVAARNARRLLNQVNTLLDFSQAEARHLRAHFDRTDLSALTCDIASIFRSAAERAGLQLHVSCPPLPEPVWVDALLWEKIVSNLLSNALKFTFTGEIRVELRPRARHAELVVHDTGVGIPAEDQAHVFKRFHRVRGRRGRTNDGSGIGLALVFELVRLHQGRVRVHSTEGRGSTFTVWMPMGRRPHDDDGLEHAGAVSPLMSWTPEIAAELAQEAAAWTPGMHGADEALDAHPRPQDVVDDVFGPPTAPVLSHRAARARVLVVDDNADMRDYLRRLLEGPWDVALAADGSSALTAIQRTRPDVVLADVMMPDVDGFELVTRIRNDDAAKNTPVILVTARAGEQAAIEGLRAGADDYIAKPFSPRELVARVQAVIERSRVEAELREHSALLRGQREALEAAVNGAPIAASLGALVRTASAALGDGTRAAIYLANDEGATLHHVVGMSDDYARAVDGFKIGPESLACGLATATGVPVLTTDVMLDPRWEPWRGMAAAFDYRGCWSFPIHTSAGRFIGTLAVYSQQPREATSREIELAAVLTHTAAIILAQNAEADARHRAEGALRRSREDSLRELEQMRHLQKISSLIIEGHAGTALHEEILDAAMAITRADFGSIQLLENGNRLELLGSRSHPGGAPFWQDISAETGTLCRSALERGARVIVSDVHAPPSDIAFGADTTRLYELYSIEAVQSTPLVSSEGRTVGVIASLWRDVHTPDQRELALPDILARQAADFFERRRTQGALHGGAPRSIPRPALSSPPATRSSR